MKKLKIKKFCCISFYLIHHLLRQQSVTITKFIVVFESLAAKLGPDLYCEHQTATPSVIARAVMCEEVVNQKRPHPLLLLE